MSDIIDRWLAIRDVYHTVSSAAAQLDVKPSALEYAIRKARRVGDPRIPDNLRKTQPGFEDVLGQHPVMATSVAIGNPVRDAAARYVRRRARNPDDAANLLDALGLTAEEATT